MTGDALEDLLRSSDPARTPLSTELTPAQLAVRDRIMRATAPTPPLRGNMALVALPLAAVLVLILAVVAVSFPVTRAQAALTPRPLAFTNTEHITAEEVIAMTTERLSAATGPSLSRHSESTGWYIQISQLPEEQQSVAISPQLTTTDWEPDGSGTVRMVAGEPYWADGSDAGITDTDAPPAGTELMNLVYPPGEMGVPTVEPAGDAPDAMRAVLVGLGLPAAHDGADVMDFIDRAMQWWTFDNAQHAALIRLVFEQDNVRVLGTGMDRAGREVIGVTAESARHPDIRTTLLISAETGRIVGMESTRTAPDGDIPEGAVIAYTMWELK
jgi:hypothetical protein